MCDWSSDVCSSDLYLGKRIRYVCGSLITVHRLKHFVFCHERNSSYYSSLYLTRRLSALWGGPLIGRISLLSKLYLRNCSSVPTEGQAILIQLRSWYDYNSTHCKFASPKMFQNDVNAFPAAKHLRYFYLMHAASPVPVSHPVLANIRPSYRCKYCKYSIIGCRSQKVPHKVRRMTYNFFQ